MPGAKAMVSELWEGAEGPSEPRASSRLALWLRVGVEVGLVARAKASSMGES